MGAVKVTLTLPREVLEAVDCCAEGRAGATRSAICAEALRAWLERQYDAELTEYYQTLSDEERAEDAAWHALTAESARRLWP